MEHQSNQKNRSREKEQPAEKTTNFKGFGAPPQKKEKRAINNAQTAEDPSKRMLILELESKAAMQKNSFAKGRYQPPVFDEPIDDNEFFLTGLDIFITEENLKIMSSLPQIESKFIRDLMAYVESSEYQRKITDYESPPLDQSDLKPSLIYFEGRELMIDDTLRSMEKNGIDISVKLTLMSDILNKFSELLIFTQTDLCAFSHHSMTSDNRSQFRLAKNIVITERAVESSKQYRIAMAEALLGAGIILNKTRILTEEIALEMGIESEEIEKHKKDSSKRLEIFFEESANLEVESRFNDNIVMTTNFLLDGFVDKKEIVEIKKRVEANPLLAAAKLVRFATDMLKGIELNDNTSRVQMLYTKLTEIDKTPDFKRAITNKFVEKDTQNKAIVASYNSNQIFSDYEAFQSLKILTNEFMLEFIKDYDREVILKLLKDLQTLKTTEPSKLGDIDMVFNLSQRLEEYVEAVFIPIKNVKVGEDFETQDQPDFSEPILEILINCIQQSLQNQQEPNNNSFVGRWQTVSIISEVEALLLELPDRIKNKVVEILDKIEQAQGVGLYRMKIQTGQAVSYGMQEVRKDIPRLKVSKGDMEFDISYNCRMFLRGNNGHSELVWAGNPHPDYKKR